MPPHAPPQTPRPSYPAAALVLALTIGLALLAVGAFAFAALRFGPSLVPAFAIAALVVAAGGFAGAHVASLLTRPLRDMTGIARRVAAGDWKGRAEPGLLRESAELAGALNELLDALEHATEENAALAMYMNRVSRHALALRDMERRAIATELHDRVGQNLAAAQITVRAVRGAIEPLGEQGVKASAHLGEVEKILQAANERTRNVLTRLRPPLLDEFGVAAALESHARQMAERGSSLVVSVASEGPGFRLEATTEGVVFEVLAEALHNVEKHAMTERAHATVRSSESEVEFLVHDEGRGFDPAAPTSDSWGIASMRERIRNLGGRFEVRSVPGAGTDIRIVVPRR